jgi:hypothetical protein
MIVEADGSVSHVALRSAPSGVQKDIIESALTILNSLPKAKPAECNGQKVPVRKTLPIFLLPDAD